MKTSYRYLLPVLFLYFIPIVLLLLIGPMRPWAFFASGLGMAFIGALVWFLLLARHEQESKEGIETINHVSPDSADAIQKNNQELILLQERYQEAVNDLQGIRKQHEELVGENEKVKAHRDQLVEMTVKQSQQLQSLQSYAELIQEKELTIQELKILLQKHQEHVVLLETKEQDLQYEIKTLLELTNFEPGSTFSGPTFIDAGEELKESFHQQASFQEEPVRLHKSLQIKTPEAAAAQLNRCLDIAAKITGTYPFPSDSHVRHTSFDNALELRHLFELLRAETGCMVIFFSPRDNKLLFANPHVKDILGWSSDRFVNQFHEIIEPGAVEWRKGISSLSVNVHAQLPLAVKASDGKTIRLQCTMGLVSSGLFRHSLIGILYTM